MEHPLWMLVPWAVFAVAAGFKFWRLTALFRKGLLSRATSSERFRQSLERIWGKGSQYCRVQHSAAPDSSISGRVNPNKTLKALRM
jgi:hypothetical protein